MKDIPISPRIIKTHIQNTNRNSFNTSNKSNRKTICGYGASTKGNVILQYCGIDDSLINPTDLAKKEILHQMLLDVRTNTSENPEIVARFLNDVFRAKYPQNTVDRGSTYVGLDSPISNKSISTIHTK